MKKTLSKILIATLFITVPAYAEQQVEDVYQQLVNPEMYFKSPQVAPQVEVVNTTTSVSDKAYNNHMPFFKETRLRFLNFLNVKGEKNEKKIIELEKKWAAEDEEKDRKEWADYMYVDYEDQQANKSQESQSEEVTDSKELDGKDAALVGGVKEQVTQKEMILDCDEVKFNEETNDIEAVGNPFITFPSRGVTLKADFMTYNRDSNILKAIGNVVVTKDGVPSYGDFIQVNLNEETMFMDKLSTENSMMQINAKSAESENGVLILNSGKMHSDKSNKFVFRSRMIGPDFSRMLLDDEEKSTLFTDELAHLKISASNISVKSDETRDIITAKDSEISYNGKYLFTLPSITAYTNKHRNYFEANYPEFGSRSMMGMFAGPGFVIPTPNGSTLKLIPMLNYKDKFGFGGAAKFKSSFNDTFIMYGSANDAFIMNGKQRLDDNLMLRYGSNSFMNDWFIGYRMPKYIAELVYDKTIVKKDFLAKDKDLAFRQYITGGYVQDGEWNIRSEDLKSSGIGTMRLRYMAEFNQTLFKYEDKANKKALDFGIVMQGSAAVYGTGDTQMIGRIGPRLHTQYKYWMQDIGYMASAFSDHTPLPVYDTYRYGHSSVYINEALRLHKYLSIGWSGWITLSNDSPNGEMFQENRFILSLGPDDFKFNICYDLMRKSTYMTFVLAFDTKKTQIEYDRLEIKNPENMGGPKKKKDLAFLSSDDNNQNQKVKPVLKYAEIIDIEDPDKEKI